VAQILESVDPAIQMKLEERKEEQRQLEEWQNETAKKLAEFEEWHKQKLRCAEQETEWLAVAPKTKRTIEDDPFIKNFFDSLT